IGGYDPFLIPMAISLSWGLFFGTLITLFATPILYVTFADLRFLIFKKNQDVEIPEKEPTVEEIEKEIETCVKSDILTEIKQNLYNEIKAIVQEELGKKKKSQK
ncbi:MAG TPA: hypothetical protein PK482_11810, partial [Spirochaetota bacterium]|nr:hypothetical protein [Spirochaetota bacterium]